MQTHLRLWISNQRRGTSDFLRRWHIMQFLLNTFFLLLLTFILALPNKRLFLLIGAAMYVWRAVYYYLYFAGTIKFLGIPVPETFLFILTVSITIVFVVRWRQIKNHRWIMPLQLHSRGLYLIQTSAHFLFH